jgi:uncharacterized membrane protein
MFSIIAVILCLLGFSLLILKALLLLNNAYRAAAGMPSKYRRLAWLRSMRDDPRDYAPLTGPEKALLAVVFLAIIVLLIWFFFFAHYNLGV